MKNPELDMLIDDYVDYWFDQGREAEHVYGVENFMSGLGKKLIYYVYEKGRNDAVKEIKEAQDEQIERLTKKK